MKLKTFMLFITAVIADFAVTGGASAASLNHVFIDPASSTETLNSQFSVLLQGENFATGVDGGAVDILFDPTILQVQSVNIDAGFWDVQASYAGIDNTAGLIDFLDVAQFSSNTVDTVFDIATITFSAIAIGGSDITPVANPIDLFAAGGNQLVINYSSASVQVIPEPGCLALLTIGLLGFGVSPRKITWREPAS